MFSQIVARTNKDRAKACLNSCPACCSPELVKLADLAAALRPISRAWIESEVEAGRIPYLSVANKRFFNLPAIKRALADRAAVCQS